MSKTIVHFKGIQEFHQNVIFSLFTGFHIRVHLGIIALLNIVKVKDSTLVFVHNFECFHGIVLSELIHFTSDSSQEFIVVNGT